MKKQTVLFVLMTLLLACTPKNNFEPRAINFDRDVCYVCLMGLTDQRYNAQAINEYGEVHWYDDIGCLVEEMNGEEWEQWRGDTIRFWIGDASKGNVEDNWIDAEKAFYDYGKHTPMGYGYSAYEERPAEGEVYTFEQVIKRINEGLTMRESYLKEKMMMHQDNPEQMKKFQEKLDRELGKKK
jgi:copper chaperone NosL